MNSEYEKWISLIKSGQASCVVVKGGEVVFSGEGRGVKPIMQLLRNEPELLNDACVFDKIIGKAAAMLLSKAGTREVYAELMSRPGYEYLSKRGIKASYGTCVKMIENRQGTGPCPLEAAVTGIEDEEEGFIAIQRRIEELMRQSG